MSIRPKLFITGSSGFIARHLAQRLVLDDYDQIYFLSRSTTPLIERLAEEDQVTFIQGSIYDADRYTTELAQVDTVVHLAALTGKARPAAHFDTNAEGTAFFLRQCEQAGVQRFLHISTIAVTYPDVSHYPYAQAKQQAEAHVTNSGLHTTILRPTVVLGEEAPVWQSLSTLAQGAVVLVFGNGTPTLQPIHVEDVVTAILSILDERRFDGETYDLGGPEPITIDDFLTRIHRIYSPSPSRLLHLPLKLLLPALIVAEKLVFPLVPFTVGQLSLFRYDSTVQKNPLHDQLAPRMIDVDRMLARLAEAHRIRLLDEEGRTFCAHLIGQAPNAYVLAKYRDGNAAHELEQEADADSFERFLIRIARKGPWFAKLADTYASLFAKNAVLRKKLILLLAILESSFPTSQYLDAGRSFKKRSYYGTLLAKGIGFACTLLLSALLLMPWHLMLARRGSSVRATRAEVLGAQRGRQEEQERERMGEQRNHG